MQQRKIFFFSKTNKQKTKIKTTTKKEKRKNKIKNKNKRLGTSLLFLLISTFQLNFFLI